MNPLILPLSVLAVIYVLYRRSTRKSIAHIRGPKSDSFLLGNMWDFHSGQAADADFRWQQEFGGVVRIKAPLGEDRLWVSDPKALQYIYHTSGYNFRKQVEDRALLRIVTGTGLVWAEGDIHKRHKKVMLPGFGTPESKAFLPIFRGCAEQITTKWKDIIAGTPDQSSVFDIPTWMTRATLDAIGEAAFDYKFESMHHSEDPVANAYTNLFADMFNTPAKATIFMQNIMHHFPMPVLNFLLDYAPVGRIERARHAGRIVNAVAKDLVEQTMQGKGSKDILSLLVRANSGENPKGRLQEEEMYAQMRTILLAGHETTTNTLSWMLFELAKNPAIQTKLRTEIRATEAAVHARGDADLTAKDFDAMPYTIAVMKEAFRFHPVSYNNFRQAAKDEVLPLSKPLTTTTGEVITEILVPEGTNVITSIAGYNRDKDVWGQDSHTFRPERWLEGDREKATSLGVYGNLLTFAGGVRGCIGWKFAVIEMQAFIVELVGSFEYALAVDAGKIRREPVRVMVPTVVGEVGKGGQLPLRVTVALKE